VVATFEIASGNVPVFAIDSVAPELVVPTT
jgi:hypothetical protein